MSMFRLKYRLPPTKSWTPEPSFFDYFSEADMMREHMKAEGWEVRIKRVKDVKSS